MDDKINTFTMVEQEVFSPTGKIHIFTSTHVPGFSITSIGGRQPSTPIGRGSNDSGV